MTEMLINIAFGLSCGSLVFHLFVVVLGASRFWFGTGFFFLCAIASSLLRTSYETYRERK